MSDRSNDLSEELLRAFSVLEVAPSADFGSVRTAYKELAKIWHPDRFEGDASTRRRAEEKFKQINSAYEILESFFARRQGSLSSLTDEVHRRTDPPRQTVSSSSESWRNQPNHRAGANSWLLASLIFGVVVVLVSIGTRTGEQTLNHPEPSIRATESALPSALDHAEVVKSVGTVSELPAIQQEIKLRKGPLTQEEKNDILRYVYKLDPKEWDYEGGKPVKKQQAQEIQLQLPRSVKFVVVTDSETYYTEREPKPFGSGFKLTDVVRQVDVIVTGNIQIIKVPTPKN